MSKERTNTILANPKIVLQLFVSGMSSRSMNAIENIRRFCDEHLAGAFELEIVDIYKHPEVALEHQIVFSPSLIKLFPLPKKILIGNLANTEKLRKALVVN